MSDSLYRYCPACRTELTPAERGGMTRLVCPKCTFVHWQNPVPVVAAIVERDDHVILVRSRGRPATWFGLVAGFLERGEHPEQGALREVDEELGIDAKVVSFLGLYPFERLNQIIFAYHVAGGPGPIVLDDNELDAFREVPIAKLKPWRQGTGPALREWLAERGFYPEPVDFGTPLEE
jgi:NADH pyrophosphatase NudC (nudix superfamily)